MHHFMEIHFIKPYNSTNLIFSMLNHFDLKPLFLLAVGQITYGEYQLQISGQYREQFSGYHNRGYLGVVHFPIN